MDDGITINEQPKKNTYLLGTLQKTTKKCERATHLRQFQFLVITTQFVQVIHFGKHFKTYTRMTCLATKCDVREENSPLWHTGCS